MNRPAEREYSLDVAKVRVEEQLALLGLRLEETVLGNGLGSVLMRLSEGATGRIAQGSGKGRLEEARVGARFEALEHYLDEHQPRQLHLRSSASLACEAHLQGDFLLPWLKAQPDRYLACQRYTDLHAKPLFDYPIGITRPDYADQPLPGDDFDHRGLRRYSSNDGAAIGASRDEALLHALNQIIERDALSLFMLRHFYYQRREPVLQVLRPAASSALSRLWGEAERCLDSPIAVLDISNEFASRSFLALCLRPASPLQANVVGCGASLDPWHGMQRALSELVQLQLNSRLPQASQQLQQAAGALAAWPRLQRCQQRDIAALLDNSHYCTLPEPLPAQTVTQQLQVLVDDFNRHGHQVGICEVFRGAQGISLVNALVPGLERFHLVWSGNLVLPGPRGLRLAKGG
ncbi:YcaO-like family protein [Pseudomonas sp. EMN2]|uniref:YcaO-like family protein n=1 Tax=Pseudomonas sp. EMN2 TaxID=2615212 RepID=UPI00129ABC15|nr:YcaO-like family protein [Pseudomonas sp. EMN2]